ncbi:MAG TPA: ECF-type sigma factor [Gemmatimonadaceae bacterium]|nr:ECF-type sigma factor [Gemmatimonadaceae bacterium]
MNHSARILHVSLARRATGHMFEGLKPNERGKLMPMAHPELLNDLRSGGHESLDRLLPIVYEELRAIAHRHLTARGQADSLVTSALVHEAYLKLVDQTQARWKDRAHFFALASVAMRHILVDRAKARRALKRGGVRRKITLDEGTVAVDDQAESLLDIDDALTRLAAVSPRLARIVECRFYGGLSEEEIAEVLGVTVRTVQRDWAKARMLLRRVLGS